MNVRVALLQIASQHTKSGQRGGAGCPGIPGQIKSVWVAGSPRNTQLMDNPLLGSISTREALNVMKAIIAESKANGGRIINIASQAAKTGFPHLAAYVATKHGLVGLTRSNACELGSTGSL